MEEQTTTQALYLRDLGQLVQELARAAKAESGRAAPGQDSAYAQGTLMAFHEIVSLMRQQANAFGLSYEDIRLDDLDPERDLL